MLRNVIWTLIEWRALDHRFQIRRPSRKVERCINGIERCWWAEDSEDDNDV
jgi:hypothetical protein